MVAGGAGPGGGEEDNNAYRDENGLIYRDENSDPVTTFLPVFE